MPAYNHSGQINLTCIYRILISKNYFLDFLAGFFAVFLAAFFLAGIVTSFRIEALVVDRSI